MRIIVISDTHKDIFRFKEVVNRPLGADLYLFLGDGYREFNKIIESNPNKKLLSVRGNCDFGCTSKVASELSVGEIKVFYTHGDHYNVKRGLDMITEAANSRGANIVLFGHTHIAYQDYQDGLHIFNPGSLGRPRTGKPSFGIVDITPQGIVTNVVSCD